MDGWMDGRTDIIFMKCDILILYIEVRGKFLLAKRDKLPSQFRHTLSN
jgi:hypothetical protein